MQRLVLMIMMWLLAQVVWASAPVAPVTAGGGAQPDKLAAGLVEETKQSVALCQQLQKKRDEAADERAAQAADRQLRELQDKDGKCKEASFELTEQDEPTPAEAIKEASLPPKPEVASDKPLAMGALADKAAAEVRIGGEAPAEMAQAALAQPALKSQVPATPKVAGVQAAASTLMKTPEKSTLTFAETVETPPASDTVKATLQDLAQKTASRDIKNNILVKNAEGDIGWVAYNKKKKRNEFVPVEAVYQGVPPGFHPNDKGGDFGDFRAAAGNLKDHRHEGTDWMGPKYAGVYSMTPGKVLKVGKGSGNFGQRVWIETPGGQIGYAHLAMVNPDLRVGDRVALGDWLGVQGNSGAEWSVHHLHLETRLGGQQGRFGEAQPTAYAMRRLFPSPQTLLAGLPTDQLNAYTGQPVNLAANWVDQAALNPVTPRRRTAPGRPVTPAETAWQLGHRLGNLISAQQPATQQRELLELMQLVGELAGREVQPAKVYVAEAPRDRRIREAMAGERTLPARCADQAVTVANASLLTPECRLELMVEVMTPATCEGQNCVAS